MASHALQRYHEAVDAFTYMFSLLEQSSNPDARRDLYFSELRKKYAPPSQSETVVDNSINEVFRICPLVLIDVKSGRLCDGPKRRDIFKSEQQFKELISSMAERLDHERIQRVVEEYFQYVTFSHVWGKTEALFKDVNLAGSVWQLGSSPGNEKLRKFCEVVRDD